jgi:hypothetical protein
VRGGERRCQSTLGVIRLADTSYVTLGGCLTCLSIHFFSCDLEPLALEGYEGDLTEAMTYRTVAGQLRLACFPPFLQKLAPFN